MTTPLHLPGPEVSLPGFELRAWAADDIPDLVSAWEDPEMHRWMPEEADPFGVDEAIAFVEAAARGLAEGTALALAICDARTKRAIGSVTFHVWGPRHWNIGYWVSPRNRNRGLATAAVSKLSRWAFSSRPSLQRISLYTLPGNAGSQKVADRAGFVFEGLLRRWADVGGQQWDWAMYSLTRDDVESSD
jgi:ribosomal-protein-alanine N-acetyltransferase